MTNDMPIDVLEARAAEERQQLHRTMTDLKYSVREQLDVKRQARAHMKPAAAALAGVGLILGYGVAGMFYD